LFTLTLSLCGGNILPVSAEHRDQRRTNMNGKWVRIATLAFFAASASHAADKCQLQKFGELPVTMNGTRPIIEGTVNGVPAKFIADSGAFYSLLTRHFADRLKLGVGPLPENLHISGTGGSASLGRTRASEFSMVGYLGGRPIRNVEFMVASRSFGNDIDGIIGQNLLAAEDTEYDLANGVIRLFRAQGCSGKTLAYWAAGNPVGEIKIDSRSPLQPQMIADAKINGKKIDIILDSGAWRSVLTYKAAARIGITPQDDDVTAGGISRGLGKKTTENSLAYFESLDIGGEVIKNARLRIGDINLRRGDMLLGADFFLSHRIYVASKQNKVYFTYNGGAVFDLRPNSRNQTLQASATDPVQGDADADAPVAEPSLAISDPANPIDAASFHRRGLAYAGRNDFQNAIADFDQAIKLSASAETYYQRGVAHMQNSQPFKGMEDFNQALQRQSNHVGALIARGRVYLRRSNELAARADLNAAKLAAQDPIELLQIAGVYSNAALYDDAIAQLNEWEVAYPKHDLLADALALRCRARATANKQLDLALVDCNTAIKKRSANSEFLDNRAFTYLQLRQWDKSIADYQAALKLQPKSALSMYGLGVARIKKGLKAEGDRDIQEAIAINSGIAAAYKQAGLAP
jgi:tetratricopeptide (TPR) repeat protein